MKRLKISWATSAISLLLACSAQAENQLLDEIVVRGTRERVNEETLTIREVRESPARDLGEALNRAQGMASVRKGAIGNDVVLRGFQKDNINLLIDGTRLHGACPSRMDPPSFHIDFAEVEQVKVTKGPYDLFNPGGMAGTVEVMTKQPEKGVGGSLDAGYGSWNNISSSLTASYGAESYGGLLGYAYSYSDSPRSGDGKRLTEIYPTTSMNRYRSDATDSRAYEINSGWAKVALNPTGNSLTEFSFSHQDADHVLYPYLKMDADYDRTNRINWTYRITNVSSQLRELKLQLYWDGVRHLMDDRLRASSLTTPRPYSMQTDARTHVYGAKLVSSLAAAPGMVNTGIDYYNRNWDALNRRAGYFSYREVAMVPDSSIENLGLFGEYRVPLSGQLNLSGGVRGDLTRIEADKSNTIASAGDSRDFTGISGNLQLNFAPADGVELFAGLGRGTRTPDQQELYLDVPVMTPSSTAIYWHGNKDLRATVNHQADIGVKLSGESFYVTTTLFYSDLQHFITPARVAGTFEKYYRNVHATMWGVELETQLALRQDFFLRGTLSYSQGENESDSRPLSEIPPLRGTVSARYDNGTWFLEALESLAREQDRVDASLQETATAGWAITDLKGGFSYKSWTLTAGVNNLLDKQYFSHLSYARDPFQSGVRVPESGRNLYLSILYHF